MRVGWKPKSTDPMVASARFRCLTPLSQLRAKNFPVEIFNPDQPNRYTLVIFSKLYDESNYELARSLKRSGVKVVLDLSDNHFFNPNGLELYVRAGASLRRMIALVDFVICCSEYLAKIVRDEAAPRRDPVVVGDAVEDLCLAVDLSDGPKSRYDRKKINLLWFGSHGSPNARAGMEDLNLLTPYLELIAGRSEAEIAVISNNKDKYAKIAAQLPIKSTYRDWSLEGFAQALSGADAVMIPISSNPFTYCKSNNRLATALWYGVPALADWIPAYEELRPFAYVNDWENGIEQLLSQGDKISARTRAGTSYCRVHFSKGAIARQWERALSNIEEQSNG